MIVLSQDLEAISPVFNSIKDVTKLVCPLNVNKHFPNLSHIFIVLSQDPEAISPVFNSIKDVTEFVCSLNVYKHLPFLFQSYDCIFILLIIYSFFN